MGSRGGGHKRPGGGHVSPVQLNKGKKQKGSPKKHYQEKGTGILRPPTKPKKREEKEERIKD